MKIKPADRRKYIIITALVIILAAFLIFFFSNRKKEPDKVSSDTDISGSWYMVNDETMKFHRLSCSQVQGISEDCRCVSADKEALKKEGYTPCKECNP